MQQKIHDAFDSVHASQQLKDSTMQFLTQQHPPQLVKKQNTVFPRIAAACLVFALLAAGVTSLYFVPVSAIHIDTDPTSAELKVNCFNRVIGVNGNADADHVRNMNYEDAVLQMLTEVSTEDTVITVVGNEKMLASIENNVQEKENVHCAHLAKHAAKQAQSHGMSAAKYEIYLSLLANGIDITTAQAQQMSMQALRSLLNEATTDNTQTQTQQQSSAPCATETACEDSQGNHGNGHHGNNHH